MIGFLNTNNTDKTLRAASGGLRGLRRGKSSHTADRTSRRGQNGEDSAGFINTLLPAHDNEPKMCFYLDRFLQHRHSAWRLRLSVPVACFPSFLSALSLLGSPGGAAAEDLNTPTVSSRT